jgi:preprotein translocase subunit SecD
MLNQILPYKCGDPVSQDPTKSVVVCDTTGQNWYMLGPVLVPGTQVSTADAQAPNAQNGSFDWTVIIQLKSSGQATWAKYTAAHHNPDGTNSTTTDPTAADYVAFTLDDKVISNTNIQGTINGSTQVSGQFTQSEATQLANSLKYGALPLKFTNDQQSTVTATLGAAQLKAGLLAGGIGLMLVVIYSLLYYRALGLVTISSLIVSGGLTFACLVILGTQIGFTLTLAGIAGFIVAVGITADSFVVFFERIKDEVHEGRSMRVAVPRAWIRARRTILSADTVSFLAAAVLYEFAAGDVRGFAFTLGMSTILDLVVVFLFTHPLVSLLSRSEAFGSARFTGLDAVRDGGVGRRARGARKDRSIGDDGAEDDLVGSGSAIAVLEDADGDVEGDVATGDVDTAEPSSVPTHARRSSRRRPAPVVGEHVAAANGVSHESTAVPDESADSSDVADTPAPVEAPDLDQSGTSADPPERPKTTPAPGSAAERAAARRAKMRAGADAGRRSGREGDH